MKQLEVSEMQLLAAVSMALDAVEREVLGATADHSKRVAYFGLLVGRELGLNDAELTDLVTCSVLHDNALTEYITRQFGEGNRMTLDESAEGLSSHCTRGEENIGVLPYLSNQRNVIKYHHENMDGTGMFGVRGGDIPLLARVIRVCDRTDVMMGGLTGSVDWQYAHDHLKNDSGSIYDPLVAKTLDRLLPEGIAAISDGGVDAALFAAAPDAKVTLDYDAMIEASRLFARIIDFKSPFTRDHSTGIADKAGRLAVDYGFDKDHVKAIYIAALLHDIGKLTTPREILEKPGRLTTDEYSVMKDHVFQTHVMLSRVDGLSEIEPWASGHHERLDGSGYFRSQKGDMGLECRMLQCVDVYQALVEDRPYRRGKTHAEAMLILNEAVDSGKLCGKVVKDIDRMFK